ncbi:MAG: hypothetical protein DMF87_26690 [Acidobacteria bacterium]|nr:MAG: hypothetical protein DMF87_26690 [Acidobacteriota bacterium]
MIVHLDTSVLIDVVTRTRPLLAAYESTSAAGHRLEVSAPVLFEFLRGPPSPSLHAPSSTVPRSGR